MCEFPRGRLPPPENTCVGCTDYTVYREHLYWLHVFFQAENSGSDCLMRLGREHVDTEVTLVLGHVCRGRKLSLEENTCTGWGDMRRHRWGTTEN